MVSASPFPEGCAAEPAADGASFLMDGAAFAPRRPHASPAASAGRLAASSRSGDRPRFAARPASAVNHARGSGLRLALPALLPVSGHLAAVSARAARLVFAVDVLPPLRVLDIVVHQAHLLGKRGLEPRNLQLRR